MKTIGNVIARIRREKFAASIEREIYHQIFPHMNGQADHGYPFSSDDELYTTRLKSGLSMTKMLNDLELAALRMPEAEANAFLYIAHRDLEERARMYLKFANARNSRCPAEVQSAVATPA